MATSITVVRLLKPARVDGEDAFERRQFADPEQQLLAHVERRHLCDPSKPTCSVFHDFFSCLVLLLLEG
jgi:hypothetical protein